MRILYIAVTAGLFGFAATGAAENLGTVDQFLSSLSSLSTSKCRNRGALAEEFEAQGKAAEARSVRQVETSLCECMPAQLQTLRASLTTKELQRRVTESEFQARYVPRIINKCAAGQLRSTFGDGCSALLAKFRTNSAAYCRCMLDTVSKLSDAEAAQIGKESSEYIPLAAEAKERGEQMPERPPGLRRFAGMEAACAHEAAE